MCASSELQMINVPHPWARYCRNAVRAGLNGRWEKMVFRGWLWGMLSPTRYRVLARLARWGDWAYRLVGMHNRVSGNLVHGWTRSRLLPDLARRPFRDWSIWQT